MGAGPLGGRRMRSGDMLMTRDTLIGILLFAPFAVMVTLAIILVPEVVWAVMIFLIILGMGAIGFARILRKGRRQ